MFVMALGAVFFGFAVGYITYRVLARPADRPVITDLAAIVSVIGGAAVTGLFNGDLFGWYSIGLIIGLAVFFALHLLLSGRESTIRVIGLLPGRFFGRTDGSKQKTTTPQA